MTLATKKLFLLAALAALGGCATGPYNQGYNGTAPAYAQTGDPSQWRVVSVTPVPRGTAERVAQSGNGSAVEYSSVPVTVAQPVYVQQPVYVPQSVYVPQPVYAPEPSYWYPPVSLSLGFVFGKHWGGGGRYRGHGHRGHR